LCCELFLELGGGGGGRIRNPVVRHLQEFLHAGDVFAGCFVAVGVHHPLEDVLFRRFGQMNHVVGVKAVVPQLVHHDFVAREIMGVVIARSA